jgi:hypothetical protein
MRPRSFDIIDRTIEEVSKLGNTPTEIAELIGCRPKQITCWLSGEFTPSAFYLQRFHEVGCDVLYILTGRRYTISGGDTDV